LTQSFLFAFLISFLGSIPPGAVNLSVLKMSVEKRISAAFRFTLAAVLIEVPYAWVGIKFQDFLTRSPILLDNFKLIAAGVLILMGLASIIHIKRNRPTEGRWKKIRESGFRKGALIALFNPMYIPFWMGITAYLVHQEWVRLDSNYLVISYLAGLATGSFFLLAILILLGKYLAPHFRQREGFQYLPGAVFLLLGLYALLEYFHIL
jgi:threonine/homoserine/homoserine lactone efflux protein